MTNAPIRRLDIVQWILVIIFTLIGMAVFFPASPIVVILFIFIGWGVSWIAILALFGLPLTHPVIVWLTTAV